MSTMVDFKVFVTNYSQSFHVLLFEGRDVTKMKNIKVDRRSEKTKKVIREAFLILITENDISKITIKEISDLADINRKTFYAYYKDKYDLLDEIENEFIEKFVRMIDDFDFQKLLSNPYEIFYQLTKLLHHNMGICELFINNDTLGNNLLEKIKNVMTEKLLTMMTNKVTSNDIFLSYINDFIVAGLISAYTKWFKSDRSISLEELSQELSIIITNGTASIRKISVTY